MKTNLKIANDDCKLYSDNNWCCIQYAYDETTTLDDYAKNVDRYIGELIKKGDNL